MEKSKASYWIVRIDANGNDSVKGSIAMRMLLKFPKRFSYCRGFSFKRNKTS